MVALDKVTNLLRLKLEFEVKVMFSVLFFLFSGSANASPYTVNGISEKRWYERMLEYSFQELITVYVPHVVLVAVAVVGACYVYDPSLRLLLYSALPERHQSWLAFIICIAE